METLPLIAQGIIFRKNDSKIEYLLVKRSENDGGFWQGITGHVRDGEKIIECLIREIEEETGIKTINYISNCVEKIQWSKENGFIMTENVYIVEVPTDSTIVLSKEHTAFKWCSFSEAFTMLYHYNNKNTLELINKHLKEGMIIKSHYIIVDGLDLSGKSSTVKKFIECSNLQWEHNCGKLTSGNVIYDYTWEIDKKEIYDKEIIGQLYLVSLLYDVNKFQRSINHIQETCSLLRTLNYHKFNNNNKLVDSINEIASLYPIPDKSFFLTADINTRQQRLKQRIKQNSNAVSKNDMLILTEPKKFIQMEEALINLYLKHFNTEIIDTSKFNVEEVVDIMFRGFQFEKELANDSNKQYVL